MLAALVGGCGGGGNTTKPAEAGRLVSGDGFTYRAPSDWTVTIASHVTAAKHDQVTLVSVTVLPLVRAYRPALFPRVIGEVDRLADTLASRLHGSVASRRTIALAGGKVRQYEIDHGGLVDRLTFVFRGKREYLLTCRWRNRDGEPAACTRLVSSFSLRKRPAG